MVDIRCQKRVFKNIKAILFDKDGTLADSHDFLRELAIRRARLIDVQVPGIGDPLLMAFGVQGRSLDPLGLMAVGSRQENEIAAAAYIAETGRDWLVARTLANQAFVAADQYLLEDSPLFAGSSAVIQMLANAGLKLGILSADTTANVQAFVEQHQLSDCFQLLMGTEGQLLKPDPMLLKQACETMEVRPKQTLMVGDAPGDMVMAHRAGIAGAIGISWRSPNAALIAHADVVIEQLGQIQLLTA